MPQKIALFGGTFDPIHKGHIHLAEAFAERLRLDKVLLMPTFVPPHKLKLQMAPEADRLAMCRLAVAGKPLFEVSDLEIRRGGASFTADTLRCLAEQYPDAEWCLITGADMFLTLGTWWRFEEIAATAVLCTAPRDTIPLSELQAYAAQLEAQGARCRVEDMPLVPVSSTAIRQAVEAGKPLDEYVPDGVAAYIREHGLYGAAAPERSPDEQFTEIIRVRETPQRFAHSLAVAEEAERLAVRYGADAAKARTAGLLHDILKDADRDALLQICRDFAILLDDVEKQAPNLWHARIGAAFIEEILGVRDADICNAVRYHTTARAGMSPLEKILYLADLTSADRHYADVAVMRRLVDESLDKALAYALTYSIRDRLERQEAIHPDTMAAYNELMLRAPVWVAE